MHRLLAAGAVAMLLAGVAVPASAQDEKRRPPAAPDAAAHAALEALRRALAEALQGLPHYAAPEFTERGDIIIRRIPAPAPPSRPRSTPRVDEVST